MRAGEKVEDLTMRQSFMTYLKDWIVNPHYRKLRDEQKSKIRRAGVGEEGWGTMSIIFLSVPLLLGNMLPPNTVV